MTLECRQTSSGPHVMTNDSFIKKQWAHTQVLETGVRPHPHNGLACSSRLGGGTETQESRSRGRSPAPGVAACFRVGAACFRVGTGQGKGELAQRPGLFPPESRPSLPGWHRPVQALRASASTLPPRLTQEEEEEEETRPWVTTAFTGPEREAV